MIAIGKHLTQKDDLLSNIEPQQVFESIKNPEENIKTQVERLRLIKTIDKNQYGLLKRQLPYLVCGIFNPPYRRIENFGYTECFIVDIDHIAEKGLNIDSLREKLTNDSRTVLCFLSPGEDGLKVLFRLSEKCSDAGRYSLFYKAFIQVLAQQHNFEQVLDKTTSDVSRACFMSYDPEVFFNPSAEAVDMKSFVDFNNPFAIKELEYVLKKEDKKNTEAKTEKPEKTVPDNEAIAFIKERLQTKSRIPHNKPQVYVPDQLEMILERLLQHIAESGVKVEDIVNIHYGKKFKFSAGATQAEVNLFFGKRGFSAVKSPRQGTSDELNELMTSYIKTFIDDYVLINTKINISQQASSPEKPLSDFEIIRQNASTLKSGNDFAGALPLYRTLWEGFRNECSEWEGWYYAFCLKQMKDYKKALEICRQVYPMNRNFEPLKGLYAWCIYYTEISPEKITAEETFFRAAEAIVKLTKQEDLYSAHTVTVFKILNHLNGKTIYPMDKILEWTGKLKPELLDTNPFSFNDKEGLQREIASKKEQYYMWRTRALLEKGLFEECIRCCQEALTLNCLHYDNDVWFRWRIALSYEGLDEYQKSLDLQLELLQRKKEWFIQKEIAEQYYRLGEYEKSLAYALDSALNFGDIDKKINTFIVLANALEKLGKTGEAQLHNDLIEKIKRKDSRVENEIRNLKSIWNALKYNNKEQYSGIIKSLLPNGKAGFVETKKGMSYYFSMRDFHANPKKAIAGTKVSFYLAEGFDVKKNRKTMNAVEITLPTAVSNF
jgi:tetratricopeptide (TPR) repeat protein